MAITTDTITLPGYTILTDSITGGIAVIPTIPEDSTSAQYYIVNEISDKLSQISEKLTDVATALETLATLSSTTGIKTLPAYSWLLAASMYKISVDDDGAIGLSALTEYHTKLNDITKF